MPPYAEPKILNGRCQCGALRYVVTDEFEYALNCHCSDCRRVTGAAFKPIAGIRREKLALTQGENDTLIAGEGGANFDTHCKRCGSLLFSVVRDGAWVHVLMGTLDDAPSIRPDKHIFVGSKAPWFIITDDLPQFDAFPP